MRSRRMDDVGRIGRCREGDVVSGGRSPAVIPRAISDLQLVITRGNIELAESKLIIRVVGQSCFLTIGGPISPAAESLLEGTHGVARFIRAGIRVL